MKGARGLALGLAEVGVNSRLPVSAKPCCRVWADMVLKGWLTLCWRRSALRYRLTFSSLWAGMLNMSQALIYLSI